MPNKALTHLDCRKLVCGVCLRKEKHTQSITPSILALIRKHQFEEYSLEQDHLPVVVCKSCVTALKVVSKDGENAKRKLPQVNFNDLEKPRAVTTRSADNMACQCTICKIGRLKAGNYRKHEDEMRQKPGRPRMQEPENSIPVTTCSYCHSEVGQGKRHECTRTEMQENLYDMIRQKSEKTQEQVTSKMLDAIFNDKGVSKQGGEVTLSTKGTPKPVVVGKNKLDRPRPKFTLQEMTKLQVSRNFSDKDINAIASFLRIKTGRNAVEPNLQQGLTARNHELENMFYKKEMVMKEKPKKDQDIENTAEGMEEDTIDREGLGTVNRPGIFVKDIDSFTKFLVNERSLDPHNHVVQFGFDDEQGILKIMEIVKSSEVVQGKEEKRSKYSDGVCPKTAKLSSVKKMFVVGLVPDVQEIYPNVKAMLDEINLEGVEFGFSADLKIYLCITGKQVASCTHACVYCEGESPWEENSKPLTIGSLFDWHQKFLENGANRRSAKMYQNVVNRPLLIGEDEVKTLEILNPPQLHLMTGVLGKLIKEMEKHTGEKFVSRFLRQEDISRCVYQGSRSFEGNQARKLLKSVDKLEREVKSLNIETLIQVLPYVETLRSFDKVVSSCFAQNLDPDYNTAIQTFSTQYRSLGISVTPKVIIIYTNLTFLSGLKF